MAKWCVDGPDSSCVHMQAPFATLAVEPPGRRVVNRNSGGGHFAFRCEHFASTSPGAVSCRENEGPAFAGLS
jgi:hypothetical protein